VDWFVGVWLLLVVVMVSGCIVCMWYGWFGCVVPCVFAVLGWCGVFYCTWLLILLWVGVFCCVFVLWCLAVRLVVVLYVVCVFCFVCLSGLDRFGFNF